MIKPGGTQHEKTRKGGGYETEIWTLAVWPRGGSGSPVVGHADNAVFFGDDDRRAHHILESVDFAQQTWPPSLRLGLDF